MAELKTKETDASVEAYLEAIEDETRRQDCRTLIEMMRNVTNAEPKMWGSSIVGFGSYHYKYASGHEGDMCVTGFSSRKSDLTLYAICSSAETEPLFARLGKHKRGKGCLYVKRLSDVSAPVLSELITLAVRQMKERYPEES